MGLTDWYAIGLGASLLLPWLTGKAGNRPEFVFNPLHPILLCGISRGEAVLLGCLTIANGLCVGMAAREMPRK